jgi:hypothetical protein
LIATNVDGSEKVDLNSLAYFTRPRVMSEIALRLLTRGPNALCALSQRPEQDDFLQEAPRLADAMGNVAATT